MKTSQTPGSKTRTPTIEDLGAIDDEDLTVVGMPGFKSPPATGADPLDPATTTVTSTNSSNLGGGSDVDVDGPSEPTTSTTTNGQSSRGSSNAAALPGLEEIAATLVGLVSILVRAARTRLRPLPPAVWIADEEDQAAIGGPLARLAARHMPIGGKGSEDAVDGISALVGVTGYVMKGLANEAEPAELVIEHGEPIDA